MNKYEDIINLSRPKSKHPSMSLNNRSAQFAPFSALTGYDEKLKETARMTYSKIELTDERKEEINNQLLWLSNHKNIEVKITYFEKDKSKVGGSYKNMKQRIKKINITEKEIILSSNKKIKIDNIVKLEFLTQNIE